jgi:hypothetical protein
MGHPGSDCAAFWRLAGVESAEISLRQDARDEEGCQGQTIDAGAPLAPNPLIENEALK